ncbi:hypothetical protein NM688_g6630 [Phlebia brevispora]|uniref:Uncharacterized protein n=1 Tax=Phlebia brevispora TaxID=194682 RepID=A0ACC1SE01_9APHY|nr:hypothetical protein NM688_g6630 [Phlebia brevispora]
MSPRKPTAKTNTVQLIEAEQGVTGRSRAEQHKKRGRSCGLHNLNIFTWRKPAKQHGQQSSGYDVSSKATASDIQLEHIGQGRSASEHSQHDRSSSGTSDATVSSAVVQRVLTSTESFWNRLCGKDIIKPGILQSIQNLYTLFTLPWLIVSLLLMIAAWAVRFKLLDVQDSWAHRLTFSLCFLSLIPLEVIADWGGEQMTFYLGDFLGDLVVITLDNAVEAALAVILLVRLRMLQATVVGVVILHLLLVAGTGFFTEGLRTTKQESRLDRRPTDLNHALLTIGIFAPLLMTGYFAALDGPISVVSTTTGSVEYSDSALTNTMRGRLLQLSRGLSVILIVIYSISRIYIHFLPQKSDVENPSHSQSSRSFSTADSSVSSQTSVLAQATMGPGTTASVRPSHTRPADHGRGGSLDVPLQATVGSSSEGEEPPREAARPPTPSPEPPEQSLLSFRPGELHHHSSSFAEPEARSSGSEYETHFYPPSHTSKWDKHQSAQTMVSGFSTADQTLAGFSEYGVSENSGHVGTVRSIETNTMDLPQADGSALPSTTDRLNSPHPNHQAPVSTPLPIPQAPTSGAQEHERQPKMNPWVCMIMLLATVALIASTAEFMVESIELVQKPGGIQEEFFGLILLPLASFSASGIAAILTWIAAFRSYLSNEEKKSSRRLLKTHPIDLSIQFTLFWIPFLVLLGWRLNKPMMLMFDSFELILLASSSYMVNNVTVHAKTNWAKGLILVSLYVMIATSAAFYTGQPEQLALLNCTVSVSSALESEVAGGLVSDIIARHIPRL